MQTETRYLYVDNTIEKQNKRVYREILYSYKSTYF